MITQEQFNENAYCAVVAYIDDILSISPDQFRSDFTLSVDNSMNVIIESWNVQSVAQPTILQIRESLDMTRVNQCITALS